MRTDEAVRFVNGESVMEAINPVSLLSSPERTSQTSSFSELDSADFLNRSSFSAGVLFFAPLGRPRGLPDWPGRKRVAAGGLP